MVKIRHRAIKIIILIMIFVILLAGCWDYRDIEEHTIVLSIGVDLNNGLYDMSGEFAVLDKKQENAESGKKKSEVAIFHAHGKNFEEARNEISGQISKPPFLGATNLIIFGTEFAKSGIEPYINRIDKLADYRKTSLVTISRETPLEIFELGTDKTMSIGTLIFENMQFQEEQKSGVYVDVSDVQMDIDMGKVGSLIPYIGIDKGEVMIIGMAAMRDNKMVGTIDLEESRYAVYLKVKGAKTHEVITYRDSLFAYEMQLKKRQYKFDYKEDRLTISVDCKFDAMLDHQYYKQYLDEKDFAEMEKALKEQIETNINKLIKKSKEEFESDIFGLGRYFRAKEYKLYKVFDWKELYLKSDFVVNADVKIMDYKLTHTKTKRVS